MDNTNRLRVIFGDSSLGIRGESFHYIFNYGKGGLESLRKDGREWLYRVPRPTFWRAMTDNDKGCGFPQRSHMWIGADLYCRHYDFAVKRDGILIDKPIAPNNNQYSNEEYADTMEITFFYDTGTQPSAKIEMHYLIEACGIIRLTMRYIGQKGLPELPALGIRFIMPTYATLYQYEGLSGETYPDRMDGGIEGIYTVEGLPVTPYLVPQECGMHMNTKWLKITRNTTLSNIRSKTTKEEFSLLFEQMYRPFAFSALPYTCHELEQATHHEELPAKRRTVVTILGEVRGVGGIDSWGSDVEEAYRIDASKDYEMGICIY